MKIALKKTLFSFDRNYRTLDQLKVLQLSGVASAMGQIPFISVGFSVFSMISDEIDIGIAALKIKKTAEKVKKATHKIQENWGQPVDPSFAAFKMHRIASKQETLVKQAEILKKEIENHESEVNAFISRYEGKKEKLAAVEKELENRNKIAQVFGSISAKWELWQARSSLENALTTHNELHEKYSAMRGTHSNLGEKREKWEKIHQKLSNNTATQEDLEALETMRAAKVEKWKSKKIEHLFSIGMEVVNIVIRLVAIAAAIATIALALIYTGGAAIPAAALIAMGVIGIAICASKAASYFYQKWIYEPAEIQKVEVPDVPLVQLA